MTPNDTKIRRNLGTSTEDLLTRLEVLSLLIGSSDHASAVTVRDAISTITVQAEELARLRGELAASIELGNGLAARVREFERLWETEVDNAIEDSKRHKAELARVRGLIDQWGARFDELYPSADAEGHDLRLAVANATGLCITELRAALAPAQEVQS